MFFTLLFGLGGIIPVVLVKLTGFKLEQLAGIGTDSPYALVQTAIVMQGIMNCFTFLVPAILFAYLSTPRPLEYLGLRTPGKSIQVVLAVFIMLGAAPVLQKTEELIGKINFGAALKAEQAANDNMTNAFLNMNSFAGFVKVFVIMAIIPALGEELFFRGMMMRLVRQRSRSMLLPVLFTATLFAFIHANVYGLLSILLAGVLLAVIYNLTGSLWCSIAAHMSFNGITIILVYLSSYNNYAKAYLSQNSISPYFVVAGAIVFGISFYLLLKNKTPLPANWSDNFTPAELAERTNTL